MLHKMLKLYEVTTCVYLRPQHWKGPFEPFRNLRETGFKVFIKTEICAGKGHSSIFTNKPSNWTNVPYHCQKNEILQLEGTFIQLNTPVLEKGSVGQTE